MEQPSRQHTPGDNSHYQYLVRLVSQVNKLEAELAEARRRLNLSPGGLAKGSGGLSQQVNIPAVNDPQAAEQVYGSGFSSSVPTISISGSGVGASFGSSPSFVFTITNAATFRTAIGVDAPVAITGATIPLAKITVLGADGSITVNANGRVSAYVAPT